MSTGRPDLTVDQLLAAGFECVGDWELNDARDLHHRIALPSQAGVYAFAVDGIIRYVGLASTSIRQRLGFYRKPGSTQRTNTRLNEEIRRHLGRGARVEILIAHPPDRKWNGLHIKGAEGLEAGLIETFDLPWNMRGSAKNVQILPSGTTAKHRSRQVNLADQILQIVRKRPAMTELEIAKAIYGPGAVQQQVNHDCRLLVNQGLLKRRGAGGPADPYTYFAVTR